MSDPLAVAGATTVFTSDAENRLTRSVSGSAVTTYTNDLYGRRTSRITPSGTTTYTWDPSGHLSCVTSTGTTVTYAYGITGMRESKTIETPSGATQTKSVWDGSALAAEQDSDGTVYRYLWGPDRTPLSVAVEYSTGATETFSYHTDALGSVVAMTDPSGSVVARYSYDPYGRCTVLTGEGIATRNPLRYRAYYSDAETGLFYLPARYYDPATYRFLSQDPAAPSAGDPLSLNAYAYCLGDPVGMFDPTGAIADIWREHPDGVTMGMATKREHDYRARWRKGHRAWERSWAKSQAIVRARRAANTGLIRPSMSFSPDGWTKPVGYDYWQEEWLRSNGLWRFADQPGKKSLKLSPASDSDLAADTVSYACSSIAGGIEAGAAGAGGLAAAGAAATVAAFAFIDAGAWVSAYSSGKAVADYIWGDGSLGDTLWAYCGGSLLDEAPMISDMVRHQ